MVQSTTRGGGAALSQFRSPFSPDYRLDGVADPTLCPLQRDESSLGSLEVEFNNPWKFL